MAGTNAPVNVMLAIHAKKTLPVDLYKPLKQYVVQHFSEREAQDADDDLHAVHQMRSEVEKQADTLEARRDLLQRYFKALTLMETRFPISPEKEHVHTVSFVWYDAFKQRWKTSLQNIHFEKAAVIFNIGAVQSQLGLAADRSTPAGLKAACHCFQTAAGAFAYLRDNVSMKATSGSAAASVDVSVECAGMLERLMLAQAQECFFEKVVADNRPAMLCAKVAKQVGSFYEEAHVALLRPVLAAHFDRPWVAHVQIKMAQFQAQALFRASIDLHENECIGEEIARLKSAQQIVADSKRQSKGVNPALLDALSRLEAAIARNLERAIKENDRVYLMRIPPPDTLPDIPSSCLVKPWSMAEVIDATGLKLFISLVPDSSAKALSKYTEMVDEVIRTQTEKLQQESDATRASLREMEMQEIIAALDGLSPLPDGLRDDVEAVQNEGGPRALDAEMAKLREMRRQCEEMLAQAEETLERESRDDAHMRGQYGSKWTRATSSHLTKGMRDKANAFAANLKQAGESDARVERAIRDNEKLLSILNHKPIEACFPVLSRPLVPMAGDELLPHLLKQNLNELEKLGGERADLEDMLKNMKQKDNILPRLMATTSSYEELFKKELTKYDAPCEKIALNIANQERCLKHIQKVTNQIVQAVIKYREIKTNLNEGTKFYITLQDALSSLKQQCSDYALTREIQGKDIIEDLQRQLSNVRVETAPGPPPPSTQGQAPNYPGLLGALGGMLGIQRHGNQMSGSQQEAPQPSAPAVGAMGSSPQHQGQGLPPQQQRPMSQGYTNQPPPYYPPPAPYQQPQHGGYYGGPPPYPGAPGGGYAPHPPYAPWGGAPPGYYQQAPPPPPPGNNLQYPYYGQGSQQ
ncbi:hypothetical protein CBR_g20272 [Chara braunii]|uniref:BRO1 domain-containing protein n=1 Tax=Chara braunii TaxID=69332 RepID=A0A388L0C0_CHABU|nr:hypothetical protein CBR_g20272 [Chara braunii]|eukprot:GBG75643.1 hypothetical protein CBR_g20272 [Chara braunii]